MKSMMILLGFLMCNAATAYNPIVSCDLREYRNGVPVVTALAPIAGGKKGNGIVVIANTRGSLVKGFVALLDKVVIVQMITLDDERYSSGRMPYHFNHSGSVEFIIDNNLAAKVTCEMY